jgi:hypothetical protein
MKSGSLVHVVLAVGFLLPVAVTAAPGSASACGSAVYLSGRREKGRPVDPKPLLVAEAEQALGGGREQQDLTYAAKPVCGLTAGG